MLANCAVYDPSLLSETGSSLASGGQAGLGAAGNAAGATGMSLPTSGEAGVANDPDVGGTSGSVASAGKSSSAGGSQGSGAEGGAAQAGSAQAGSAQGGSAQGGSAQAGSAQGGAAQGGSAQGGGGGTVTPHDLSTGKPATASSQEAGNEIEKGNDGNLSTRWCGKDDSKPQWWRVDLGSMHELSSFRVSFQITSRAYTYVIDTSADDKAYTRRLSLTGKGAVQTGDFPSGVSARYVRITVTQTEDLAPGVTVWASFFEFTVLGL